MKIKERLRAYIAGIIREETESLESRENVLEGNVERLAGRLAGYEQLAENVRNLNAMLEGYNGLNENVRNLNAMLEGYDGLTENVKNLNEMLEGYSRLSENVKNLNEMLRGYSGLEENIRNLNSMLEGYDGLNENVRNLNAMLEGYDSLIENIRNLNSTFQDYESALQMQKVKIAMLEKACGVEKGTRHNDSSDKAEAVTGKQNTETILPSEDTYSGIDYFDFENHFRGSMQRIRETQETYVKYFKGRTNIVDLGCGRGEFLELMRENGIDAQGADLYEEFAEMCRLKDLKVTQSDAVEFLKRQQKVGGIFAAQLIEHLPTGKLVELCRLAYEKLEEGAYIVMETPNPQSLSIYTNSFYIDPSHNKPVHPLTVQYILQKAGFKDVDIVYTEVSRPKVTIPSIGLEHRGEFDHAMKQVENILFGSQDYAVIAKR